MAVFSSVTLDATLTFLAKVLDNSQTLLSVFTPAL